MWCVKTREKSNMTNMTRITDDELVKRKYEGKIDDGVRRK